MLSIYPLFLLITIILNNNKSLQVHIVFFWSHSNERVSCLEPYHRNFFFGFITQSLENNFSSSYYFFCLPLKSPLKLFFKPFLKRTFKNMVLFHSPLLPSSRGPMTKLKIKKYHIFKCSL